MVFPFLGLSRQVFEAKRSGDRRLVSARITVSCLLIKSQSLDHCRSKSHVLLESWPHQLQRLNTCQGNGVGMEMKANELLSRNLCSVTNQFLSFFNFLIPAFLIFGSFLIFGQPFLICWLEDVICAAVQGPLEAAGRLGHKTLRTLMKRSSLWYLPGAVT